MAECEEAITLVLVRVAQIPGVWTEPLSPLPFFGLTRNRTLKRNFVDRMGQQLSIAHVFNVSYHQARPVGGGISCGVVTGLLVLPLVEQISC
jgi:hypothetical protein